MAIIPGSVRVAGFIAPSDTADTYATHEDTYGKGGYQSVADNTARDAISTARRKEGMMVKVLSSGIIYTLDSNLTSWTALPSSGGTVTSVSVVSANGLAGTVANSTTTPAITLSTSITGILKGNGTAISAATGADLPTMTSTVGGAVPTPPNNTNTFLRGDGTFATPSGGGDVSSNTAVSVDGEIALFNSTTGKQIKRATGTGIAKITSGVLSTATAGTDYVAPNGVITGATKTKVTYDAKGLVTAGADATTADIADSTDKRYCTDAQKTVIGNTSGINTGDETTATIKTKLGAATTSTDGYLTSTNWNTFNNKQPAGSYEVTTNKATDFTTVNNTLYPTVQATKTYADSLVVGLLDYRGAYDASGNTYPTTGGSGTAGAVLKGDMWIISVAGTLGGSAVQIGDSIIANVDAPGQTSTKWNILNSNIAYVPEDVANKSTSTSLGTSNTLYPTQNAVKVYADTGLGLKANLAGGNTFTGTQTMDSPVINTTATGTGVTITGEVSKLVKTDAQGNIVANAEILKTSPTAPTIGSGQMGVFSGSNERLYRKGNVDTTTYGLAEDFKTLKYDTKLYFNGTTSAGTITDNDNLSFTDGASDRPFTIIVDIKNLVQSATTQYIVSKRGSSTQYEYQLRITNADLQFQTLDIGGTEFISATFSGLPNNFTGKIGIVYDGLALSTSLKMYIDGLLVTTTNTKSAGYTFMTNSTSNFYIGTRATAGNFLVGEMAMVRIYNVALTQAELQASSYNGISYQYIGANNTDLTAGNGSFATNTTGWWLFTNGALAWNSGTTDATYTANGTASINYLYRTGGFTSNFGKRYRLTMRAKSPTATNTLSMNVTNLTVIQNPALTTTYQTYIFEFIPNTSIQYIILGSSLINGTQIIVDDIIVQQVGCVLDLTPDSITTSTWYDKSGNSLNATNTNCTVTNTSGYVPISRTLTINGTTLDLSADRSWTVSGGGGGFELLATAILASPATSLSSGTFTAKKNLIVKVYIPSTNNTSNVTPGLRFNNDTGNNYSWNASTNGASATQTAGVSFALLQDVVARVVANADTTHITANISNFQSTMKIGTVSSSYMYGNPATSINMDVGGFNWNNTSAQITAITLVTNGGTANFATGTTIQIYGSD